jgi:hypothetical protein
VFRVIRTIGETVYAPPRAFARPMGWSEIGRAALLALGITVAYESKLTGVFESVRYVLSPRGQWDALSARYLLGAFREAIREGIGWLILLGGIVVPMALLFGNVLSTRQSLCVIWQKHYRQVLGAAVYGWTAAHGLMLAPALLMFPAGTPRYEAALGLAVLPPFVFFLGVAVREMFSLSLGRMLAVLLPVVSSLVAAPVVGKGIVCVAASPMLILIGQQLLTPYVHRALVSARWSRASASAALGREVPHAISGSQGGPEEPTAEAGALSSIEPRTDSGIEARSAAEPPTGTPRDL